MNVDVAIIGAGPSGIQAGIHASRKKVSVAIIGKTENSAAFGAHIENLFGATGKADGSDLLLEGIQKAERFGCKFVNENVISAVKNGEIFELTTESDIKISSRAVILASGISRNKLGVPGEKEFLGKGVSYCAACDSNFFKGKTVAVIGEESEAAASAELMTRYASRTYWIAENIKASAVMTEKARKAGAEIIVSSVTSINGDGKVTSVTLGNGSVVSLDGVFIELGGRSSADLAMDLDVMPGSDGMIPVDAECRTSAEGIYACGDITGKPWQVAKAVGQGAVAGTNAADRMRERNVGE